MAYNLIQYTEQIDHPVWERSSYGTWTLATVAPGTLFAPNDVQSADVVTLGAGPSARTQVIAVDPDTEYTFSAFVHAGTADLDGMQPVIMEGFENVFVRENVSSSQFTAEEYIEGWVRVYRTFTTGSDVDSVEVGVGSRIDQDGMTFSMWGLQLVPGDTARTYERHPEFDEVPEVEEPPIPEPVPDPVEPPHPVPVLPSLDDTFHEYFTNFSVHRSEVVIPDHFAVYAPDNNESGQCVSVITPEPDLGARRWTHEGKWITIGIYRDEGRKPSFKPESTTTAYWVRSGNKLVITDRKKHQLILGEKVIVQGMNIGYQEVTVQTIINEYVFIVDTVDVGSITGNSGTYQGTRLVDFAADHVVFRLLPSFKLVSWKWVKDLFQQSSPSLTLTKRTLFEITRGAQIHVSNQITKSVNFKVPNETASESSFALRKRFGQLYDEQGEPLKAAYDLVGQIAPPYQVDSKYKNNPLLFNNTYDNVPKNYRVFVYDYYGIDLNDVRRGPYFVCNLISRDERKAGPEGNIKRKADEFGTVYYNGPLFDEYMNPAVGIQDNNALVTKQNILPIVLDSFNHPVKSPLPKRVL